ncbi:spore coat protein U-like protein [Klebsiella oxytoca]|uniref:Spore coat protein U-like protein n=1 Tax=Klebsiella oxytoca TaxID=571 RepID=A0A318FN84_KLEOX|nr:spore coat U domain-containing protein [Klebsiella oxytoca]PXW44866.1 spore coat protein U-like protein [Klebsiella oxytoca]HCB1497901.1 spore coat U domain-containing protein [Klebsiella michiganensis]HCB1845112.1 spore coat U domain-containing protein [Klebsiella oxytoca]
MNVKTISRSVLGGLLSAVVIIQPSFAAGTLSGQIGVQLTLGSGCRVSNGSREGELNKWGNINFGAYGDLANSIDAGMVGSGGATAVSIACTAALQSTLTLDGGQQGSTTLRYMKNTADNELIAYRLYSDVGRNSEILPDGSIAITGTGSPQEIPIFARIRPEDQDAPTAGNYSDIVTATLTW